MGKILVVDDEAASRDLLKHYLKAKDYAVITACDGMEAIEKIKENPDLVLLDVKMPEMDGLQALKKIKEITPSIGVVMVTGLAEEDIAVACVKEGAYDYVTKPIDMNHLNTVVELYMIQTAYSEEPADDIEGLQEDTIPENAEEHTEEQKKITDTRKGIEKRRCRRFRAFGASGIIKEIDSPAIPKGFSKAHPIWDISKGGLTFTCSESLKKDQKIILQLVIPGEPVLEIHSIVKRVGQPDSNGDRLCSIKFIPFGSSPDNNSIETLNVLRMLDKKYGA